MAQIRHKQLLPIARHRHRIQHGGGGGHDGRFRQIYFGSGGKVRLSQDKIRRRVVLRGDRIPHQHAVILRIGHIEAAILNPDALRSAE